MIFPPFTSSPTASKTSKNLEISKHAPTYWPRNFGFPHIFLSADIYSGASVRAKPILPRYYIRNRIYVGSDAGLVGYARNRGVVQGIEALSGTIGWQHLPNAQSCLALLMIRSMAGMLMLIVTTVTCLVYPN